MEGSVVGGVWKKCEKLLKKKSRQNFLRTGILEVGLRPKKKVAKYSGQPPPPKLISPYALGMSIIQLRRSNCAAKYACNQARQSRDGFDRGVTLILTCLSNSISISISISITVERPLSISIIDN
jgi:hypothetical protein